MKQFGYWIVTLVALTALPSLAAPPQERAEAYYRSFDSTSIVAPDAAALRGAHDQHVILRSATQLAALNRALAGRCNPVPSWQARDLRLLIQWSGKRPRSWQASRFAYQDSRKTTACQFSQPQQKAVLAALGLER